VAQSTNTALLAIKATRWDQDDPYVLQGLRDASYSCSGRPLKGHAGALTSMAVSPDDNWLVTGGGPLDGKALLRKLARDGSADPEEPVELCRFPPGVPVVRVTFSPDGRWLAVAGETVLAGPDAVASTVGLLAPPAGPPAGFAVGPGREPGTSPWNPSRRGGPAGTLEVVLHPGTEGLP
jgi:hypothetical protein